MTVTYVEFEILLALATSPGRVWTRDMLLTRIWGDSRLPRPAHDRRAHPPPAREARARRQGPGVPVHRARSRLPLPRRRLTPRERERAAVQSITNRLALLFFAITLVVDRRALHRRHQRPGLAACARRSSTRSACSRASTAGRSAPRSTLAGPARARRRVRRAADASGARVTLLGVNEGTQGQQVYPRVGLDRASATSPTCSSRSPRRRRAPGARSAAPRRATSAGWPRSPCR